jgi:hypothetical protein
MFRFVPPRIGGVAFIGYNIEINSTDLVMKLLHEQSVLLVPGDAFGLDGYLRIGYGAKNLQDGLALVDNVLRSVQRTKGSI